MPQLIQQQIILTDANPTFQFEGNLGGNLGDMIVSCIRQPSATPFPPGEVRQVTANLLLSTDGGANYLDQGGCDWTDAVTNSQEPSGMNVFITVPKSGGRRIRVIVTKIRGERIPLLATITAN